MKNIKRSSKKLFGTRSHRVPPSLAPFKRVPVRVHTIVVVLWRNYYFIINIVNSWPLPDARFPLTLSPLLHHLTPSSSSKRANEIAAGRGRRRAPRAMRSGGDGGDDGGDDDDRRCSRAVVGFIRSVTFSSRSHVPLGTLHYHRRPSVAYDNIKQ